MHFEIAERSDAVPIEHCNLEPGQMVKLMLDHFTGDDFVASEAMWVEVTDAEAGRYRGELRNDSLVNDHVRWGDGLPFEARHVLGFMHHTDTPGGYVHS